ncbi:glycosyltransferase family 39 protein [Eubacteriaceae bacterium ES3]|nr:glycosyltransferase family 39 protein [Eubacteriaceae bacterium ES3]
MKIKPAKNNACYKKILTLDLDKYFIFIFLFAYFIFNLFFLTSFPYVHSDESWLSGLSRHILETGSINVTEPFFDAYIRYPHAIRIVFHLLQALFIPVFGYQIFTFRLLSLLLSIASLFFFYNLSQVIFKSNRLSMLSVVLLSIDIQYIYASHFARQEIAILFFSILTLFILLKRLPQHRFGDDLILGTITGLSIGFHPNSFIIAVTLGILYLYFIFQGKLRVKNLVLLVLCIAAFALFFVGLSIYMDPDYLSHYTQHGKNFGVGDSLFNKLAEFFYFYKRLFNQISVEYYMPDIRFQLILFTTVLFSSLIMMFKKSFCDTTLNFLVVIVLAINLGLLIIGRYNVTSVIFSFPYMYLLTIYFIEAFLPRQKKWLSGILFLITILSTILQIKPYLQSYEAYLDQISSNTAASEKVLGNLNSEYAFSDGQLLDYRNLQYLADQGISFSDYIEKNHIDTILYYDELSFIVENHPHYNIMYGDLTNIFNEMMDYLNDNCEETAQFTSPTYGTELWPQIDQKNWQIHVFKVRADQ